MGFLRGSGRIYVGMGSHHSKPSALAREQLGLCNWRNHVRNDPAGGKEFPSIVTPGGAVLYGSVPLPRIPAPDFLGVDLPFLVLDILVATLVVSTGLVMLPPTLVSLPLKLLVFVAADGWTLIVRTLLTGFASA